MIVGFSWILLLSCYTGANRVARILNFNVNEIPLETQLGLIIGKIEASITIEKDGAPFPGRNFFSFRGIPYARPPVGNLRWEEPMRPAAWEDPLPANNFASPCMQYNRVTDSVIGKEDCLYLNVYTPFLPKIPNGPIHRPLGLTRPDVDRDGARQRILRNNRRASRYKRQALNRLLPVIVFIHGGDFVEGQSDLYGPEKLMREDIVLVTFNYRLGVFGFLSTGDHILPGNYGLADQVFALQWVQDNIDEFGGDPHRVTLMGQGSGAASANYLMISPRAEGLFSQVILQSGSALCDSALELDPRTYADKVAGVYDCDHSRSSHMLDCLRGISPEQLIMTQARLMSLGSLPVNTVPVIDGGNRTEAYVPSHPELIMSSGKFSSKPVMTGVTTGEGFAMFMRAYLRETTMFKDPENLKDHFLQNILTLYLNNNEEYIRLGTAVNKFYFSDVDWTNPQQYVEAYTRMLTDLTVVSCQQRTVRYLTSKENSPIFSYVFDYRNPGSPTWSFLEILYAQKTGLNLDYFYRVVSQGDELSYLFLIETSHPTGPTSPIDNLFSMILTRMWAMFVSMGAPTFLDSAFPDGRHRWLPTSREKSLSYNLTLEPDSPMIVDYKKGESLFWSETLPYIVQLSGWLSWMERWRYDVLFWLFFVLLIVAMLIIVGLLFYIRYKNKTRKYPEIPQRKSSQL